MTDTDNEQQRDYSHEVNLISNPFVRALYLAGGTISIVLGFIGIFLPLLPTTPFLLLSAYLYSRSSVGYYNWLMNHKRLGPFIRNYREGNGIPIRVKVISVGTLWITIGTSSYFFVSMLEYRAVMIGIACVVSWYILSIPTLTAKPEIFQPEWTRR